MNPLILKYKLPIRKELHLTQDICQDLRENRQILAQDAEAGGILLGSIYKNYVQVDAISVPAGNDVRKPNYFQRDGERAQRLIYQAYEYSNGTTNYVGEWHTHYQNNPTPSSLDLSEIRNTFDKSQLPLKFVVSIIVGKGDFIGDVWIGFQDGNRLVCCPRLEDIN